MRRPTSHLYAPIDALLLLMVLIWGGNFSVVKMLLREMPPLGFNALRLVLASVVFLGALAAIRAPALSRGDWWRVALLGIVGHFVYQVCFVLGLARTSVANSTLILGCSPVTVTMLAAVTTRDESIGLQIWAGAALSAVGVSLAIGQGVALTRASLLGDLLMLAAVVCWAVYTVAARPLLARHSPLVVTGYSMAIGAACYVPLGAADLLRLDWGGISPEAWVGLVFSAVMALCVGYLIWYTAVQQIGNARTAVYANMVPVVALAVARVWLDEPVGRAQIVGVAAILLGVLLTKIRQPVRLAIPAEE